jgi:hypothetical protein
VPRARQESGGIDLRKLPYIFIYKLWRRKAHGLACHPHFAEVTPVDHPFIEIDIRSKGMRRLELIIHESMHLAVPGMPESVVGYTAKYIAKVLWHMNYRSDDEWQNENYAGKPPGTK